MDISGHGDHTTIAAIVTRRNDERVAASKEKMRGRSRLGENKAKWGVSQRDTFCGRKKGTAEKMIADTFRGPKIEDKTQSNATSRLPHYRISIPHNVYRYRT
jgi:hypothetical protein